MKQSINAADVVGEIEFELAHSSISQDELGQAIQAVRQFQNQMRAEIFDKHGAADPRELARRQFQLNDMLLAVLHQMSVNLRASQLEQRQLAEWVRDHAADAPSYALGEPPEPATVRTFERSHDSRSNDTLLLEVQQILLSSTLRVDADVRPVRIPVIGRLLTRLRAALHDVSLFYTNRMGERQTAINQALCDAILLLAEEQQRQQYENRNL